MKITLLNGTVIETNEAREIELLAKSIVGGTTKVATDTDGIRYRTNTKKVCKICRGPLRFHQKFLCGKMVCLAAYGRIKKAKKTADKRMQELRAENANSSFQSSPLNH